MATVDTYDWTLVQGISDSSITKAWVDSGGFLIVETEDGVQTDLGEVKGLLGQVGPAGTITQQDIDNLVSSLQWGPWQDLAMTSNWRAYPGFTTPAIRKNSVNVELRGLAQYIGTSTITSGGVQIVQQVLAAYRPLSQHVIWANRNGSHIADMRIRTHGELAVYIYPEIEPMAQYGWISLDNVHYPLT